VRFLVDANLSPLPAAALNEHGHDAVHVHDLDLDTASDAVILRRARDDDRVVISADSDFGTLLAESHARQPSVILIRRLRGRRVSSLTAVIVDNLELVDDALIEGSVVVLGEGTARIRRLPLL
jgi:predicted nuclease of predicted toxin-antitoxin system